VLVSVNIYVLAVIASGVWVYFDAPKVGLNRDWVFGVVLVWIVFFPWYLFARARATPQTSRGSSSPAPPARLPGVWLPDPRDCDLERYREGERWTTLTRPRARS
jgi:hypothetical protein